MISLSTALAVVVAALLAVYYHHFQSNHLHRQRRRILLFDGPCNVCNYYVNFIIDRDPQQHFFFAPLKSSVGQRLLSLHHIDTDIDSLVLIDYADALVKAAQSNNFSDEMQPCIAYIRSTGAINAVASLGFPWSATCLFLLVPLSIRDRCYRLFAAWRYTLFGRSDECRTLTKSSRVRFLAHTSADSGHSHNHDHPLKHAAKRE